MKIIRILLLTTLFSAFFFNSYSQSEIKSYSIKKGEVFDIIFLSGKKGTEDKLKDYFARAFPVAKRLGYAGLGGFPIKETPIKGNYHPQTIVFGKWINTSSREDFLVAIDKEMPDFHQMRREIWSTFNLVYYDLKEDLNFEIDPSKYNVVTYYWHENNKAFQQFNKEWLQKAQKAGGKIELELVDGKSPKNYNYSPDYLNISVWESKEAFEKFSFENQNMNLNFITQTNQFKIN